MTVKNLLEANQESQHQPKEIERRYLVADLPKSLELGTLETISQS